jgi:molybdenum cofactor cytidylyltransferase
MTLNMIAIILAAGSALRAGGPKLVWPIGGVPSVRRVALATTSSTRIDRVIVVTGRWRREVEEALFGLEVELAHNPNFIQGLSTSLKVGLAASESQGAIFLQADQPLLTTAFLDGLIDFFWDTEAGAVAPSVGGHRRSPVVFSLKRFSQEFSELSGDEGGQRILQKYPEELRLWPADSWDPRIFLDFDTEADYAKCAIDLD